MDTTTALPDAVQWSEGMLLSPQHLQQNDLYWNEQLRYRLARVQPFYWGVARLRIDPASLAGGTLVVSELECVLQDGLPVALAAGDAPLSVDVGALAKTGGRPVRVWLQLAPRGPNAARVDGGERRYRSLPGELTSDENLGDGALQVQVGRLRPVLTLYAADAATLPPTAGSACPLLELARDAEGHLRLSAYHPPMLQLEASAFQGAQALRERLLALVQGLWTQVEELAGGPAADQADQPERAGEGGAASPHLATARILARALPLLELDVSSPNSHPYQVYRSLAQLVGEVAGIGAKPLPLRMAAWRHDDCMPLFQRCFDYVEAKLGLVNAAYECLRFAPLELPGSGLIRFARGLGPGPVHEVIVELRRRDGQTDADLAEWLGEALIISRNHFEAAQRARLRGPKPRALSQHQRKERGLPPQADLFVLENWRLHVDGHGQQDAFRPETALLICGPENARMPAAIVLYQKKSAAPHA